jgi:hypothetical protein
VAQLWHDFPETTNLWQGKSADKTKLKSNPQCDGRSRTWIGFQSGSILHSGAGLFCWVCCRLTVEHVEGKSLHYRLIFYAAAFTFAAATVEVVRRAPPNFAGPSSTWLVEALFDLKLGTGTASRGEKFLSHCTTACCQLSKYDIAHLIKVPNFVWNDMKTATEMLLQTEAYPRHALKFESWFVFKAVISSNIFHDVRWQKG